MVEVVDPETGEITEQDETEQAFNALPDDGAATPDGEQDDPEQDTEGRCNVVTTVAGTIYQCALQEGHEGEHSFSPSSGEAPPAEDSEKRMRVAGEKLDREAERHWNRIVEIMGPDADGLTPCELCFVKTPGFRWDAAPNEETAAAVRIAIGLPDVSNYAPSATERICDDCRGLGKVRTGSMVANNETAKCDACNGKGYVASRPRMNQTPDAPIEQGEQNGAAVVEDDGIERDMFGTPATDPDFGKMPNMRARPVDYWQTNRV